MGIYTLLLKGEMWFIGVPHKIIMRTIKEMMDNLTDRDKYLWSLIEKLPLLPRVGMDQEQQHFWAVQIAVYDITSIDATDDFIYQIESGAYQTLDDLQHYLTYNVGYEVVEEENDND